MKFLGIVLFILGSTGLIYTVQRCLQARRPTDLLLAMAAWLAVLAALTGLAIFFVPGFI